MFLVYKGKHGSMGSKPSGKACKSSMRSLPKTSSVMRIQLDGPGPSNWMLSHVVQLQAAH
jgi:hypothetical protein